jgi:hypothetical protein
MPLGHFPSLSMFALAALAIGVSRVRFLGGRSGLQVALANGLPHLSALDAASAMNYAQA